MELKMQQPNVIKPITIVAMQDMNKLGTIAVD